MSRYLARYVSDGVGMFQGDDLPRLDTILSLPYYARPIEVQIDLEVPLSATVTGEPLRETPQKVLLQSGAISKELTRNTDKHPDGELGVSCTPSDEPTPANSLNIHFRPIDDSLTDRGMVWVVPGEKATARLRLYPEKLAESGLLASAIIAEAETAIRQNVLRHFAN